MKSMHKIVLVAGLMFQLQTTLHADAWTDAFNAFGGPNSVNLNRGTLPTAQAQAIAASAGNTPEALAVGMFMAFGKTIALQNSFQGAASRAELIQALNEDLVALAQPAPTKSPVAPAPVAPAPVAPAPVEKPAAPVQVPTPKNPAPINVNNLPVNMKQAIEAQKKYDTIAATANNNNLAQLANSNLSPVDTYKAYIDLIFNQIAQALNGIADAPTQKAINQYVQNKATMLKSTGSVAPNKAGSPVLGRMGKKAGKALKSKN